MNMIKIPAKPQKGNNTAKQEVKLLRVVAYCRVSTDNDEQATSYETQIEHYTEYINKNPEWVLVNVYADEGISTTNTKNRDQFNAMIEDCKRGLIDMILTKSISRFARNTVDCLDYIRMLKGMNIPVFFEKESHGGVQTETVWAENGDSAQIMLFRRLYFVLNAAKPLSACIGIIMAGNTLYDAVQADCTTILLAAHERSRKKFCRRHFLKRSITWLVTVENICRYYSKILNLQSSR